MAYSHFTLDKVKEEFGLVLDEMSDLFSSMPEVAVSDFLRTTLSEQVSLALAINTEKVRSELIIAPILVELRRLKDRQISFFSGVDFEVDPSRGLCGTCDFLISRSPEQFYITAPVALLVEAKRENIVGGLGQCIASMVAARLFNERHGIGLMSVYGGVTSGNLWKFLKLEREVVHIDQMEYYINQPGKILAILLQSVQEGETR
jgi:hypothetical protein